MKIVLRVVKKLTQPWFHAVVIQFILGSNDGWGDRRGLEEKMRTFLIAAVFAIVPSISPANAADGCGPGCHSTPSGACVVDGWGTGARAWNQCPVTSRSRPPCGYGYIWRQSMRACFQTTKDWL